MVFTVFAPTKLLHSSSKTTTTEFVPKTFGVICWNVHKNSNKQNKFLSYLKLMEENFDFLLFQEANLEENNEFLLPNFSYYGAANLKIKEKFYGVLTASKFSSTNSKAYLTKGKEGIFGTHKSFLLSKYFFEDKQELLILNIHAINFRENRQFSKELQIFMEFVQSYKGALIIAGDFNTWNKRRVLVLKQAIRELGLKMVNFGKDGYVKSFFGNNLDFVFYRDLKLVSSFVDSNHKLSDHNPLFAKFEKL